MLMEERKRQRTTISQMECEVRPSKSRTVPVMHFEADVDTALHSSSTPLPGALSFGDNEDTASYSSSTSVLPGGEYQVFLSFRGPDTRRGFTDCLYRCLSKSGVRTFLDDEELRKGEEMGLELLKSIRESSISIPIFSKNYASSKWCLMELTQMLECRRTRSQVIFPVFYDVTPSEVKNQSGSYGEAFEGHKQSRKFSDQTIEQWKKALKEVGHLKGWDLKEDTKGYEGKLIDEIVPKVLSMLKTKFMDVTKHLVGMDHHEKEMMRLLNIAADNVQIVGVHGMSGIGKTTVAKFIYNKLLKNFDCCSFLADVQILAPKLQGLVSLQKQLLTDTLNWSLDIANVDNGITIIKQKFCNKKILIVLDDVNSILQFHCLVGEHGCFGKGSKIIVTTKNKGVLDDLKVKWIYELPIMSAAQSLQLFSRHAFGKELPPEEYVSISHKIASVAGGLPLALESMGSYLCEKDLDIWEAASEKFTEMPSDDVWEKLRVDYVALNNHQEQIFLDIACLFTGMDKTTVFYMWEDCKYYPETTFKELYLRSLVKVGEANELWMHSQLIALGKTIVNQENVLGHRSRVWNHKEAEEILDGRMGTEKVEALSLRFDLESGENPPCFTSEDFTKLVNLRYLLVDGADLDGNFERVLLSLRWLTWRGCPPDFKPTNFRMKNLVILDLSNSYITEEWRGWKQIQKAKNLKVLKVADCALTRTPNFSSNAPSSDAPLEILILGGCGRLENIDPSIGNLKGLKVLEISHTNISELPEQIWMLKNLEKLSLVHTKIRFLPEDIGLLSKLKVLHIRSCEDLQCILGLPSSLVDLSLAICDSLEKLPDLSNLKNLSNLLVKNCGKLAPRLNGLEN